MSTQEPVAVGETAEIKRKMHFRGTIKKLTVAGAIVDIGLDKPAVLHISQVSREPVFRIEDVLEVGQEVDVWVRRISPKGIVELTMIKPLDLEWREIKKGMTVKGKVIKILRGGVEVEIGAEVPAFVPIGEMTHGYIRSPRDVVSEGDEIEAQVIEVNRRRKRIRLSMKALEPKPEEAGRLARADRDDQDDTYVPTPMEAALLKALAEAKAAAAEAYGEEREAALARVADLEKTLEDIRKRLRGNGRHRLN